MHLGVLKSFTSSALVCLVEADHPLQILDGCRSVEAKFERLTGMYRNFFRTRGSKPWVSELSRDTVCWPMSSACPAAKWNKGMATVQIMRFLDFLCQDHLTDSTDPLMIAIALGLHVAICPLFFESQCLFRSRNSWFFFPGICLLPFILPAFAEVAGTKAINIAVTYLYENGLWLRAANARQVSLWLFSFLGHFAVCAQLTLVSGRRRFPVYPKSHMLCHTALKLLRLSSRCEWILSPLATACQQEEDYIGKPSKVSRSTNVRQAHRSILWRSLIKIQVSLKQAAADQRGLNAYPDLG